MAPPAKYFKEARSRKTAGRRAKTLARYRDILAFVEKHPDLTAYEIAGALGCSHMTVYRAMRADEAGELNETVQGG